MRAGRADADFEHVEDGDAFVWQNSDFEAKIYYLGLFPSPDDPFRGFRFLGFISVPDFFLPFSPAFSETGDFSPATRLASNVSIFSNLASIIWSSFCSSRRISIIISSWLSTSFSALRSSTLTLFIWASVVSSGFI